MDFETYQSRVTNKRASRKTKFNTQHKQLSVGMKRVCHVNDKFNGSVRCYTGENCVKKAIEMLMEEQNCINLILNECRYPMTNTPETCKCRKRLPIAIYVSQLLTVTKNVGITTTCKALRSQKNTLLGIYSV